MARRQLTLDNEVAAELAGSEDSVLRELEERLGCDVFLRGNVLTLDGDEGDVGAAADDRRRAGRPGRARPRARARDDRHRHRRARRRASRRREILEDVIWAPPEHPGRAEDRQPEALRRLDPPPHDHLRDRPGRHGQDLPRGGGGGRRARGQGRQPDHPHPPGGRGRRAARLPARRHPGQGRPLPAPALRRALRHARPRAGHDLLRPRGDRGRPARLHARPHASTTPS